MRPDLTRVLAPMSREATEDPPETLDAFHRGGFWLVQPKGSGHRAGIDAMMLAAAACSAT